ncbi:MAG: RHS repeat-associated core domain-containing protein [Candidatus Auribacterota bacterium]
MTDTNGLYYMRARYYNPEVRRFVNQDVLLGNISNGQNLNRYAYVEGNPVKYVDPMGLWTKEVHRGYTIEWAEKAGFTEDEASIIAEACQKVDSIFSLTNPAFGPRYHFYGPAQTVREFQAGIDPPGQDIRIAVAEEHLVKARKLMENPKTREQGLKELGKGLHALQDIEAHMNISRIAQLFGYIFERPLKGGFMRIAIDNPDWDIVNGRWDYIGDDASPRFLRTRSRSITYLKRALK